MGEAEVLQSYMQRGYTVVRTYKAYGGEGRAVVLPPGGCVGQEQVIVTSSARPEEAGMVVSGFIPARASRLSTPGFSNILQKEQKAKAMREQQIAAGKVTPSALKTGTASQSFVTKSGTAPQKTSTKSFTFKNVPLFQQTYEELGEGRYRITMPFEHYRQKQRLEQIAAGKTIPADYSKLPQGYLYTTQQRYQPIVKMGGESKAGFGARLIGAFTLLKEDVKTTARKGYNLLPAPVRKQTDIIGSQVKYGFKLSYDWLIKNPLEFTDKAARKYLKTEKAGTYVSSKLAAPYKPTKWDWITSPVSTLVRQTKVSAGVRQFAASEARAAGKQPATYTAKTLVLYGAGKVMGKVFFKTTLPKFAKKYPITSKLIKGSKYGIGITYAGTAGYGGYKAYKMGGTESLTAYTLKEAKTIGLLGAGSRAGYLEAKTQYETAWAIKKFGNSYKPSSKMPVKVTIKPGSYQKEVASVQLGKGKIFKSYEVNIRGKYETPYLTKSFKVKGISDVRSLTKTTAASQSILILSQRGMKPIGLVLREKVAYGKFDIPFVQKGVVRYSKMLKSYGVSLSLTTSKKNILIKPSRVGSLSVKQPTLTISKQSYIKMFQATPSSPAYALKGKASNIILEPRTGYYYKVPKSYEAEIWRGLSVSSNIKSISKGKGAIVVLKKKPLPVKSLPLTPTTKPSTSTLALQKTEGIQLGLTPTMLKNSIATIIQPKTSYFKPLPIKSISMPVPKVTTKTTTKTTTKPIIKQSVKDLTKSIPRTLPIAKQIAKTTKKLSLKSFTSTIAPTATKTKPRTSAVVKVSPIVAQTPRTKQLIRTVPITRTTQRTSTRSALTSLSIPVPLIGKPTTPLVPKSSDEFYPKTKRRSIKLTVPTKPSKYKPSLIAVAKNIVGKIPIKLSGFGVRPLPILRRKKKKRRSKK